MNRVAVLGSSGSIGTSSLDVVAAQPEHLQAVGLSVHRSWDVLQKQITRHRPRWAVVVDDRLKAEIGTPDIPSGTELWWGEAGVERLASHPDVDTVICAIVGAAGLRGTVAAISQGKRVALANKETLVVGGPLVMQQAAESGARILPVDSEHSAIFQCLEAGRSRDVHKITLTASGGPFRGWSREKLENVTVEQALAHPTWKMGKKITVDSATMMNKALEVIEARWLFGLTADQIDVVVHPQSIIHSMVEFVDGSTVAQLSPPDMKLPIQYALSYPERWPGISPKMDWSAAQTLTFEAPDYEAFPALKLGFEVARRGGTSGAILNAANEVAVERFLNGTLRFTEIAIACQEILQHHQFDSQPTLSELLQQDRWARQEMSRWKSSLK
ncbi:1-deoxy-D-xylulose-5-phosphate reductoisomerase [bacterium]|nr:1-deoxy-D-xylulose-5-phosphate reductoisomerase [bacterium]